MLIMLLIIAASEPALPTPVRERMASLGAGEEHEDVRVEWLWRRKSAQSCLARRSRVEMAAGSVGTPRSSQDLK